MRPVGGIQLVKRVMLVSMLACACLLMHPTLLASGLGVHRFDTEFGTPGSGNGEFTDPTGVAVSEVGSLKGDVYVVDRGDNRVEVFTSTGTYVSQFDGTGAPTGVFSSPQWIAVDNSTGPSAGDVYVTDTGHKVIDKFSATGTYIGQITSAGAAQFEEALFGVAVDSAGTLWVYYESGARGSIANYTGAVTNVFVATRKSQAGSGGFANPGLGFAVNSEDDLYAGTFFEEIAEVNSSGEVIHESLEEKLSSAAAVDSANDEVYVDNLTTVAKFNSTAGLVERFGAEEGVEHLAGGDGLTVYASSSSKLVYVADSSANTIKLFHEVILPDVTTEAATGVESAAATLHGAVDPDGTSVTKCEFEYGTEEGVYGQTAPCSPAVSPGTPLTGSAPVAVSAEVTGLSPTTRYYFRLAASNATGTNAGSALTFATPAAPTILSEEVSSLNTEEPKFEATINPNFAETSYRFEYSTNASGETLEAPITVLDGAPPAALLPAVLEELRAGPVAVPGLLPGPTYYFRVVASNSSGTTEGPLESFRARARPAVGAPSASNTTRTTAALSLPITPQGLPTTYHVAYITQAGYEAAVAEHASNPYANGRTTYESLSVGSGYTPLSIGTTLEELNPGTTYHYTVIASNKIGSTTGPDATFTTLPGTSPTANTGTATGVNEVSATLGGSIDTRGLQTVEQFEFGTTPYAGALQPATVMSSSGTVDSVSASESSLLPGTTYYYRVLASNQDGASYGAEQSFTTNSFPAVLTVTATPPEIPYTSIAELDLHETQEAPKAPAKALTKAQKLAKALQACHHKPKKQRASCQRQAHKHYGPTKPKPKHK